MNNETDAKHLKSPEWINFLIPAGVNSKSARDHCHLNFKLSFLYVHAIDGEIAKGRYLNRSEFMRAIIRNYFLSEKDKNVLPQ